MEWVSKSRRLVVAKGQKVVEIDLKNERPDDEQLLKLLLGPTGNLRAPTLIVGKTMVVGFNQEAYAQQFT